MFTFFKKKNIEPDNQRLSMLAYSVVRDIAGAKEKKEWKCPFCKSNLIVNYVISNGKLVAILLGCTGCIFQHASDGEWKIPKWIEKEEEKSKNNGDVPSKQTDRQDDADDNVLGKTIKREK